MFLQELILEQRFSTLFLKQLNVQTHEINLKTIVYDRHARRRMKWRRISEDEVRYVLGQPEKIETTIHGRINAFRTKDERYLKVTYRESEKDILIISVVDKND